MNSSKPYIRFCKLIFILIFLGSLPHLAYPIPADVTDISDNKYFGVILTEIKNAKESILIAMYRIEVDPEDKDSMAYILMEALEEAVKRGIKVTVYLDFDYNFSAFNMLNNMGAEAHLVNPAKTLHDKVIVIDKETVITGSHNWSFSAFMRNSEDGNLIRSKEYAEIKIQNIKELSIVEPNVLTDAFESVFISEELLVNPEFFSRMIHRQEERTFDLYLLLLKYYREKGTATFELNMDKASEDLGMDPGMERTAYRRQIIKVLRKLKDRYKLINVTFKHGKPAEVILLNLQDKNKFYKAPISDYIEIPLEYWNYGWAKKLTFKAKFAYLINLRERKRSPFYPRWTKSLKNLAKLYHVHLSSIQYGLRELKKLNLIEIQYSPIIKEPEKRLPNRYFLNPLYSNKELEEKWNELKILYGEKNFDIAHELADILDDGNDPIVIERFILLIKKHGEELVRQATDIVSQKTKDNPARNVHYINGILENWKGE